VCFMYPFGSLIYSDFNEADYCDTQLPLFLAIMERSKNPIIRSNAVIALGDMVAAVSSNLMSLDSVL
jgi:hypothetical protein